jgi:hypothetical protein
MAKRLHLCIAEDHLQLDLLRPTPHKSWVWKCKRWLAYLNGDDRAFYSVVASETVAADSTSISRTLEQLITTVQRKSHIAMQGATLEVEVGSKHARVGLLELDALPSVRITTEELNAYAKTWVAHTWAWDPEDYIIRCTPASNTGSYLLICVEKSLVEQLTELCQRLRMHFADCKPALVARLAALPKPTHHSMALCVERRLDGSRAAVSQVVALNAQGLMSISNVWAAADTASRQDAELAHWVERVGAQHRLAAPIQTTTHVWPVTSGSAFKGAIP